MSYATMRDVLFALDQCGVAEPTEATPRRARAVNRITGGAVKVALRRQLSLVEAIPASCGKIAKMEQRYESIQAHEKLAPW